MESFRQIIDAFGGFAEFAKALGLTRNHGWVMHSRDSIPAEHWAATVAAADARNIEHVSLETLAALAARKRSPSVVSDQHPDRRSTAWTSEAR